MGVVIVNNETGITLSPPLLTIEHKFYIIVLVGVYEVLRLVRKEELYAGSRNPDSIPPQTLCRG